MVPFDMLWYVFFILVFYSNFALKHTVFDFKKLCDLEIRVRGQPSPRSLEPTRIDLPKTAIYDFPLTFHNNHSKFLSK